MVLVTTPPTQNGSGFWIALQLNRTVLPVQTQSAGRLPGPVANTTQQPLLIQKGTVGGGGAWPWGQCRTYSLGRSSIDGTNHLSPQLWYIALGSLQRITLFGEMHHNCVCQNSKSLFSSILAAQECTLWVRWIHNRRTYWCGVVVCLDISVQDRIV